jgi:GTP-binding protein LepA
MKLTDIRNFCIIAHIDHGKSTLADRFIELCNGLQRNKVDQMLDSMELERERGITIKAQSVSLKFRSSNGKIYLLNLIDTPGHVDFSYEVSRSIACCEGALLVVDACSSVQAQTLANYNIALQHGLVVLPVINKIDRCPENIDQCVHDITNLISTNEKVYFPCSAKNNIGIREILEAIIKYVPHPKGDINSQFKAQVLDSWFDLYLGVVSLIRIYEGILRINDKIKVFSTDKIYSVERMGIFTPSKVLCNELCCGQVGFIICGMKEISAALVGDTIIAPSQRYATAIPGFQRVQPKIFAGLFPQDSDRFSDFNKALLKLSLNDSALSFQQEMSHSLGHGFRCGFLGMLHLDIVKERLEREYNLQLIVSLPSVNYKLILKNQTSIFISNPLNMAPLHTIDKILEPIVNMNILLPERYFGVISKLCEKHEGEYVNIQYKENYIIMQYTFPLGEIISDFYSNLKSLSNGFASFDYQQAGYSEADIGILKILINDTELDPLTQFIRKNKAIYVARLLVEKLQALIPKCLFTIKIQAVLNSKILARADISALRKNVTGKCYGGDITRKMKLLEKQKEGKKRMKQIGKVPIPTSLFLSLL